MSHHYGHRQVLRDALIAKCTLQISPVTYLVELATQAGVATRIIAKAAQGQPVPTIDHLRLCAALEVDPLAGLGPAHYGLHVAFPSPSSFDFAFFATGLMLQQRLKRQSDHQACRAIGIRQGTLKRLKAGEKQGVGPVLRACAYIGVHPFGYCAGPKKFLPENVSRETPAAVA
jgi:hypothetical protein